MATCMDGVVRLHKKITMSDSPPVRSNIEVVKLFLFKSSLQVLNNMNYFAKWVNKLKCAGRTMHIFFKCLIWGGRD